MAGGYKATSLWQVAGATLDKMVQQGTRVCSVEQMRHVEASGILQVPSSGIRRGEHPNIRYLIRRNPPMSLRKSLH